jgi:hypothetical protein
MSARTRAPSRKAFMGSALLLADGQGDERGNAIGSAA